MKFIYDLYCIKLATAGCYEIAMKSGQYNFLVCMK